MTTPNEQKDVPEWYAWFDENYIEDEAKVKAFISSLLATRDEALTNAIMEAAHREDDFTTHKLATILKDLVPSFNYHAYRGKLRQEGQEALRERDMFIVGWRERDWPEGFDRKTAQMIADEYEERFFSKEVEQLLNNKDDND